MSSEHVYKGGYLCCAVRYVASGQPQARAICHCRSCQKAIAAESVAWACFKPGQVKWQGDSRSIFESTKGVEHSFCNHCGTSLSYQAAGNSIDLSLASLDEPEKLTPVREAYLSHRISWNTPHPKLPGHQKFKSDE